MSLRSTHIGYLVCALLGDSQKITLTFFFSGTIFVDEEEMCD